MPRPMAKLLRGRYQLLGLISEQEGQSQAWSGELRDEGQEFLIKLWPFKGKKPDTYQRALWDAELRILYRLGSSPGAQDSLLVLRDAGVDLAERCFVMVLETPGFCRLSEALGDRGSYSWLHNLKFSDKRLDLWRGLGYIASGIQKLHEQSVLHRDIRAENVYFDSYQGAESMRLGGFEWSLRLGSSVNDAPPHGWASPPEFVKGEDNSGHTFETDWYAFGVFAARCFMNIENYATLSPDKRHEQINKDLEKNKGGVLSELERRFLQRLIADDPSERITHVHEIQQLLSDICGSLWEGIGLQQENRPLVVVVDPRNQNLLEKLEESGFSPSGEMPKTLFNPGDPFHVTAFREFIRQDLKAAQLFAIPNKNFYLLMGDCLQLLIRQWELEGFDPDSHRRTKTPTWDYAWCFGLGELRYSRGGKQSTDLATIPIQVYTVAEAKEARKQHNAPPTRSWERFLPTLDKNQDLRLRLLRFHDFVRCTNQIELLLRDVEIFSYELVKKEQIDGFQRIVIKEHPRQRPITDLFRVEGGMVEFLHRELATRKPYCEYIILTSLEQDSLLVPRMDLREAWKIEKFFRHDTGENCVQLSRQEGENFSPIHQRGTLRSWGMFGQIALLRRRKKAIDRLAKHAYLLRSLTTPMQVYMDTGESERPFQLPKEQVDEYKEAVIKDILRVRPIYTLHGPPGTGKTTLVAHLLREILQDDPVAQILVTAQAHGAVDVLMNKVSSEAFNNVPPEEQPLTVRLGARRDKESNELNSVEQTSLDLLEKAKEKIGSKEKKTILHKEWLELNENLVQGLKTKAYRHQSFVADFCELVKRGANITYCTTSAGDLEVLADNTQSFDWSIVEEAGKAHGFDLALPLQAGHRWLLIGDYNQLPPYRIEDYRNGINHLDQVAEAISNLTKPNSTLADHDWVRSWLDDDRDPTEKEEFKRFARSWLKTFEHLFGLCRTVKGGVQVTKETSQGAAAGFISGQYRMHPTIGSLISETYYDGELDNRTEDQEGRPLAHVLHPFVSPSEIFEKSIVWIDQPLATHEKDFFHEKGPRQGKQRYTNPAEISALFEFIKQLKIGEHVLTKPLKLAVLSPYARQVGEFNKRYNDLLPLPSWLKLKEGLYERQKGGPKTRSRIAHTVDSFQGNQADIVVVSLVRNNLQFRMGFLDDPSRLNVLLSRAESLLILVGCWDFFFKQVEHVPLEVEKPLRDHLWHWRKVLAFLQEKFASGEAVRIRSSFNGFGEKS